MKTRPPILCLALGLTALIAGGCASRRPAPQPQVVYAQQYDAVYQAAVAVLRERGFVVDRRDYRFGAVSSRPMGAATVVEVWRPNHARLGTALDATLNDHRRTVTLTLAPLDAPAPRNAEAGAEADPAQQAPASAEPPRLYWLDVEVLIERQQEPRRRVGGATTGAVFSELAATPVELTRRGIDGPYWLPVGRDTALEKQIAVQVLRRAGVI